MTPLGRQDFERLVEQQHEECKKTLGLKGDAYSGKSNVLSNFQVDGEQLGLSPFQVWAVLFNKHVKAINNSIKQNPWEPVDKSEGLPGRILDAINYLHLLNGLYINNDFRSVIKNGPPAGYPNPSDQAGKSVTGTSA